MNFLQFYNSCNSGKCFQLAVHFSTINYISIGEVCLGGWGGGVSFLIAGKGRNEFPKGLMLATEVQHALYLGEVGEA